MSSSARTSHLGSRSPVLVRLAVVIALAGAVVIVPVGGPRAEAAAYYCSGETHDFSASSSSFCTFRFRDTRINGRVWADGAVPPTVYSPLSYPPGLCLVELSGRPPWCVVRAPGGIPTVSVTAPRFYQKDDPVRLVVRRANGSRVMGCSGTWACVSEHPLPAGLVPGELLTCVGFGSYATFDCSN